MTHIHRFFLSHQLASGEQSSLEEDDAFHASKVLRLKEEDAIEVADASGTVFLARVTSVDGGVQFLAGDELDGGSVATRLTVAQALTRGRKMDLVVEKLSELGVDELIPVVTAKSVERPGSDGEKKKRWRRIARASGAQAKRRTMMAVADPVSLLEWLEGYRGSTVVLSNDPGVEPLGKALMGVEPPLALVVGPESGFDLDELESIGALGGRFGKLGSQTLRTETAALVATTIVMHHMGEIG